MSQQGFTIVSLQKEVVDVGDIIDQATLAFNSKLIDTLSSEFTGNADQITFIPASGKTFYHIKSKLYPVVNTIETAGTIETVNRRADVELTFDGILKDVLTHDQQSEGNSVGVGSATKAGRYESNTSESMVGDGIKAIKLTSTNNSGTYRVHLKGFINDSGVAPTS